MEGKHLCILYSAALLWLQDGAVSAESVLHFRSSFLNILLGESNTVMPQSRMGNLCPSRYCWIPSFHQLPASMVNDDIWRVAGFASLILLVPLVWMPTIGL